MLSLKLDTKIRHFELNFELNFELYLASFGQDKANFDHVLSNEGFHLITGHTILGAKIQTEINGCNYCIFVLM